MSPEAIPERQRTDESLEAEREKTDAALAEKLEVEHLTEEAIERAREDERIDERRDEVDEALADEREASARLARLIPLERERTDQHLMIERARFDDAVANRDDFLGMVSHDLRGLLTAIVSGAELIAHDHPGHTHTQVSTARILRSAGRMSRLIGDLVDVAAIDAGKLSVVPTEADAAAVVREAVETWAATAAAKRVTLEAEVPDHAPATFDHQRILQILGNLITNAVKFSKPGGKVVVAVEPGGDEVRFSVHDVGVGIPHEDQQRIFERFWQVGSNDRRGLGLGLYIARCLVEAHGGALRVKSAPGVGSTFSFTVPGA